MSVTDRAYDTLTEAHDTLRLIHKDLEDVRLDVLDAGLDLDEAGHLPDAEPDWRKDAGKAEAVADGLDVAIREAMVQIRRLRSIL